MRRLSLLENCRRLAVATTSGSGRAPSGADNRGVSIVFSFNYAMCNFTG
jgi:hypothetical protein